MHSRVKTFSKPNNWKTNLTFSCRVNSLPSLFSKSFSPVTSQHYLNIRFGKPLWRSKSSNSWVQNCKNIHREINMPDNLVFPEIIWTTPLKPKATKLLREKLLLFGGPSSKNGKHFMKTDLKTTSSYTNLKYFGRIILILLLLSLYTRTHTKNALIFLLYKRFITSNVIFEDEDILYRCIL